jgi:hypothetical protein
MSAFFYGKKEGHRAGREVIKTNKYKNIKKQGETERNE